MNAGGSSPITITPSTDSMPSSEAHREKTGMECTESIYNQVCEFFWRMAVLEVEGGFPFWVPGRGSTMKCVPLQPKPYLGAQRTHCFDEDHR